MKIPPCIKVYGESVKGCKITEANHMATFFNTLRKDYPKYAAIALHIRNEGKRTHSQIVREKALGGFVTGCADIIVPGNPSLVIEMKSRSKSAKISSEQITYLLNAQELGSVCCIALGHEAAMNAFNDWLQLVNKC